MIVVVNIEESYFSQLLKDKKKGVLVRQKSSPFLAELKNELEKQLGM